MPHTATGGLEGQYAVCYPTDNRVAEESRGENAFNATVSFDNGTAIKVCQRQRPQIVFADDGLPGWFWSGVVLPLDGVCPLNDLHPAKNPTYTLVQQIGRSGAWVQVVRT